MHGAVTGSQAMWQERDGKGGTRRITDNSMATSAVDGELVPPCEAYQLMRKGMHPDGSSCWCTTHLKPVGSELQWGLPVGADDGHVVEAAIQHAPGVTHHAGIDALVLPQPRLQGNFDGPLHDVCRLHATG